MYSYHAQGSIIKSNGEWARTCGVSSDFNWPLLPESVNKLAAGNKFLEGTLILGMIFLLMMFTWLGSALFKGYRRRKYVRLAGEEAQLAVTPSYGTQGEKGLGQYRA